MALNERTDARLSSFDRILYRTPSVAVGAFRCPRSHPLFRDTGPIENDVFVFPRSRVGIAHAGARRFVADPGVVTLYNRDQLYARDAIDDADRSDWFAVDRALTLELVRDPDPDGRPFRHTHAPSAPRTYLRQRRLFEHLRSGEPLGALAVEEEVLLLLADVLEDAASPVDPDARDVAERARIELGSRYAEDLSLAALARATGVSRSRLCRAFRRATGTTLHAYRDGLRLRAALEALPVSPDLTALALDLGYASHSHFGACFRRAFGLTPSEARARLSSGWGPTARPRRRCPAPSSAGRGPRRPRRCSSRR
jgi:AraC-like DNA-binding protein